VVYRARIVNCTDILWWYSDKIGEIYWVHATPNTHDVYMVDSRKHPELSHAIFGIQCKDAILLPNEPEPFLPVLLKKDMFEI
jgi:hypothetical protein